MSSKDSRRIHLGAYGYCRDKDGRLLLVRVLGGPDHGAWTLPGGGVSWGEHPDQAVMREMEEETGLVGLEVNTIVAIYSHVYQETLDSPLAALHHIGIIYHLDLHSFDVKNELNGTTDLSQWLTEEDARRLSLTPLGEFGVNLAWPPEAK